MAQAWLSDLARHSPEQLFAHRPNHASIRTMLVYHARADFAPQNYCNRMHGMACMHLFPLAHTLLEHRSFYASASSAMLAKFCSANFSLTKLLRNQPHTIVAHLLAYVSLWPTWHDTPLHISTGQNLRREHSAQASAPRQPKGRASWFACKMCALQRAPGLACRYQTLSCAQSVHTYTPVDHVCS